MTAMTRELGQVITQEKTLLPVQRVFDELTKQPVSRLKPLGNQTTKSIQDLFPEQEIADKKLKVAITALGKLSAEFSKSELQELIAQVEYLAETWLDEFERDVFKGMTLNELLHERRA